MNAIESRDKEFGRSGSYADARSDHRNCGSEWELPQDELKAEKKGQPGWIFNSRSARMESISVSLWSWLVVGILSAWFVIWLAETLSRLGSRIP